LPSQAAVRRASARGKKEVVRSDMACVYGN
jgi:hypothetical protein